MELYRINEEIASIDETTAEHTSYVLEAEARAAPVRAAAAAAAAETARAKEHSEMIEHFERLRTRWIFANKKYLGTFSSNTEWLASYVSFVFKPSADQVAKLAALNAAAEEYKAYFDKNFGKLTADELSKYGITEVTKEIAAQTSSYDLAGKAKERASTAPKIASLAKTIEGKTAELTALKAKITPKPAFELASKTRDRTALQSMVVELEAEIAELQSQLKVLDQSGGGRFKKIVGSKAKVMHGGAYCTGGGLTKNDLKYNSKGCIVNKHRSDGQTRFI